MSADALVLIVDDEVDLRNLLEINLRREGFQTVVAADATEALQLIERQVPHCILLDLMLPDMSGTELCLRFKAHPNTASVPIIMVSARDEEIDRVVGFEVGADDYVVKSNLSIRELILRVRAVLRRYDRRTTAEPTDESRQEIGTLTVDKGAHRVWVDGAEVLLTATEFKLLSSLTQSIGRVQTRGFLLERVWDMPADLNTRTVDTHIKRLREKIGVAGEYIETVRGVGYRFKKPVG